MNDVILLLKCVWKLELLNDEIEVIKKTLTLLLKEISKIKQNQKDY